MPSGVRMPPKMSLWEKLFLAAVIVMAVVVYGVLFLTYQEVPDVKGIEQVEREQEK